MVQTFAILLASPLALLVVLAVGAAIGIAVERFVEGEKRAKRKAYWAGRKHGDAKGRAKEGAKEVSLLEQAIARTVPDAPDQLRTVMDAEFAARPLLNRSEQRVFAHLELQVAEVAADWKVMCQVSLGEILTSKSKEAFAAVNAKRVDFLIVDSQCRPLLAIEFQGAGHYQASAAARDAVKREALRRAGIGFAEIGSGDKPSELRAVVAKLAGRVAMAG